MIYCDTSLIVAALTSESFSDVARDLLAGIRTLVASHWTSTEVASALAMKHRRGALNDDEFAFALRLWMTTAAKRFTVVPVRDDHFDHATALVTSAPRGLRTGDALHLAIVLDLGSALASFDRDMRDAASARRIVIYPDR